LLSAVKINIVIYRAETNTLLFLFVYL